MDNCGHYTLCRKRNAFLCDRKKWRLNYFYLRNFNPADSTVTLPPDESHHAAKVLRCRPSEAAAILNGAGTRATATFKKVDAKETVLEVTAVHQEMRRNAGISVALANLKNRDRLEWFVEKAVELGAAGILIFLSSRTEKHGVDAKRLERIAVSALKQSGNLWLPEIETGIQYRDILKSETGILIAHCSEKYPGDLLKNVYQAGRDIMLLIGPEGDFTDEEIESAIAAGAVPVSLGPFRLRAETAALAALVTVQVMNMETSG